MERVSPKHQLIMPEWKDSDEPIELEHDIRELTLGWESQKCPQSECSENLLFEQQTEGIVEISCPECAVIYNCAEIPVLEYSRIEANWRLLSKPLQEMLRKLITSAIADEETAMNRKQTRGDVIIAATRVLLLLEAAEHEWP